VSRETEAGCLDAVCVAYQLRARHYRSAHHMHPPMLLDAKCIGSADFHPD